MLLCKKAAFAAGLLLLFSSCEIINPAEEIPAYIHIDTVGVTTDYASQGSRASQITDAWIYIDNNLLGTYPLPVTFPALKPGRHTILVKAGILPNGIAANRKVYPFYQGFSTDTLLSQGQILTLSPSVSYYSTIKFPWKEDFESPGMSLDVPASSNTGVTITNDAALVFEGTGSAGVTLDADADTFECTATNAFKLTAGEPVYLELNYKTNHAFTAGVYINNASTVIQRPVWIANPTSLWKKVYIDLSYAVSAYPAATDFRIYFSARKDAGEGKVELYFDNIKLVHY